jgi:tRNA dimethylallyltransferase
MSSNTPAIKFIVGPTAVGKSQIALAVAQKYNAEIVSCDAMQVYREINIASDKPKSNELADVPHHLIGAVSVVEHFDVAKYRQMALSAISDVQGRGKMPLVVGGSGMYMTVLLDGIFEDKIEDESLREELSQEIKQKGSAELHERLRGLDSAAAAKIHPNDPQRIIRALEIVLLTGQPISALQQKRKGLWGTQAIEVFGLTRERDELYRRAEARIDRMFEDGLVEEVRALLQLQLSSTARATIGIPEVGGYLNGEYDLDQAKYLMKLNTRHFIKRQLTWFRRDTRLRWIDASKENALEII